MSPKFVREIHGNLRQHITVVDPSNRRLTVQYNGSIQHPMIIFGWRHMRNTFGITGNQMLLMTYVGNSCFLLEILPQAFNPNGLPSYHTYRHFHDDPRSFEVTLTKYLASGSQLVNSIQ
jgi:hypothetical protein